MTAQAAKHAVSPVEPRDTPTPCPDPRTGREGVLDPSSRQEEAWPFWQTHAACAGWPEEWFFPDGGGSAATTRYRKGQQVCAHCPVRHRCLDEAMRMEGWLDAQWRFGLWGGLTPSERVELMRRTA